MSTRLCVFGVDPEMDDKTIVAAARAFFEAAKRRPTCAFLGIQQKGRTKKRRWLYFLVDQGWGFTFEGVAGGLARQFEEMTAILYHDGWGVFKFEHYETKKGKAPSLVLGLNTVGPLIDLYKGKIKGKYPQSGFTVAQLRALEKKSPDELTEAELAAVSEYANAPRIGLDELFPGEGREFIRMGYETKFHRIVEGGQVVEAKIVKEGDLPGDLTNFPEDWEGSQYA